MTPFGKKYLNMSLFNIILVLWLLQTVATKRNFQNFGITSHFDALLNQIPDKSVSINIIYDETDPVQRVEAGTLANLIENDLEVPIVCFGKLELFWPFIRTQRMAWMGSINIVLLDIEMKFVYMKRLHERFFTGFDLGIAEERRMDLLYENIYHIFPFDTWQSWTSSKAEIENLLEESLNLITIYPTDQLSGYRMGISWSKGNSMGLNILEEVNSWTASNGLLHKSYLVPLTADTYKSLNGRHFQHPVMHKPPWNYVTLDEFDNFVEDNGGRDVTLTNILAETLGFTFESVDPKAKGIERSRGSQWETHAFNFSGILGKLHRREEPFHFYLGDTTQTYTRNSAVDFSFMVLADSGAFVSQAPGRFVPNDILFRPFSWSVWSFTLGSMLMVWCLLILILQYGKFMYRNREPWSILYNGTTTLFSESLARSVAKTGFMIYRIFFHEPEMYFVEFNHPFLRPLRILAMVIMIVVGLVLLPSYNGALFSFFYVPFLGKPIDSLTELHKKMQEANHSVGVTAGSSSFEIISTGGGIYKDIWTEMERQGNWLIPSVQEGLQQTLSDPTFSVFAGREKLIFDSLRLGGEEKLHINREVFFTKYKAIAMRTGSPLKQAFNKVLQRLTDGGIINKITQDEYNGLTKRIGNNSPFWTEMYRIVRTNSGENDRFRPLGWAQFQGLFFITAIGYSLALAAFLFEICIYNPPHISKIKSKFYVLTRSICVDANY